MRQYTSFIWFERTDSPVHARPRVRLRPRRGQGRDVRGQDQATGRGLPGEGTPQRRRARSRSRRSRTISRSSRRAFAGSSRRGGRRNRATSRPSRRSPSGPTAVRCRRRSATTSPPSTATLRDEDGLSHEDAVRDTVVSVLMSPHFCYRIDLLAAGTGVQPLVGLRPGQPPELLPLVEHARRGAAGPGRRRRPAPPRGARRPGPADAARRPRPRPGHGVRRQLARLPPLRGAQQRRPRAVPELQRRAAAVRCSRSRSASSSTSSARTARCSISSTANHTFVNPVLARHYGMPEPARSGPTSGCGSTTRDRYGRGGLLPMAVFLTKNAPGLRTSPVKRGYWVVRRLLGENIPAPPAEVPELPSDEAKLGDLTLREALARHRADKSCAGCHERFDAIGLAFEGYGPVGEFRTIDLGGRPVDTRATFPGGGEGTGVDGLRAYLRDAPPGGIRREPVPQAAGLRPRTQPAPLGRRRHRGRCASGSRPTTTDSAGWSRASSPARSSGTSEWTATRREE